MLSGALQGKGASLVGSFSVHFKDHPSMDIEDWRAAHTSDSDRSYLDNKSVAGAGDCKREICSGRA